MASTKTLSYAEHLARLKGIAARLQGQKDPDVEQLLGDVKDAQESYGFCRERITAAMGELSKLLGQADASEPTKA